MAFIEKLDADALNMTQEEFARCMSGESVPHDPCTAWYRRGPCEGVTNLKSNLEIVANVRQRLEIMNTKVMQLKADMDSFNETFSTQIKEVHTRTPLEIKAKRAVAIDEQNTEDVLDLPSPMAPQVVIGKGMNT